MKKILTFFLAAFLTLPAFAQSYYNRDNTREVIGRVISVNAPIYDLVPVRYDCDRYDHRNSRDNHRPNIGGAIIGGALGSQVGNGRGRDLAIIAGAVIGSQAGNNHSNRNRYYGNNYRTCETRYERQIVGYYFTARYRDTIVRGQTDRDVYVGMKVPMLVRDDRDDNYPRY